MENTMKAARIHSLGSPLELENVPLPTLGDEDVLIEVKAVHVAQYHTAAMLRTEHSLNIYPPTFPAILGMGGAGNISQIGSNVNGFQEGERVVINPILTCGTCEYCMDNRPGLCDMWVLHGYYALYKPNGVPLLENYPGGFAQYVKVPARNVVRIHDNIPYEQAARFNYTGISYEALKNGGFRPGMTVLINGSTGVLGTEGVLLSLAMGAAKVIATGRNRERLAKIKELNPERVFTILLGEESIVPSIKEFTDGKGVHLYLDTMGSVAGQESPIQSVHDCLDGLKKGGTAVFIGSMQNHDVKYNYEYYIGNAIKIMGSVWYNNQSLSELVNMAAAGTLKLSNYDTKTFSLEHVNEAFDFADQRTGGLNNIIVKP
ncbi:zinc-binding dehydrogenase [Peribacillus sp. SCS-155]|uniref:zinc-dependent alcohol dehydrogenase n=1 Tax=Peribacillus sedimenti TaxID=3115297 RepID=UPI003905D5DF